ncbi:MAG: hypothetical protein DRO40_06580 [Thermoprotei archaeon]|nr:MAG: hypothetical protein DRO40_06580 [Thermoprotei archaeon]
MFIYFMSLIASIVLAVAYYLLYRKEINLDSLLIAILSTYILALVILSTILYFYYLPYWISEGLMFFLPLIIAINIPLLLISIFKSLRRK